VPDTVEQLRFIYSTAPSLAEAERMARFLLEQRLAACVNILPGMVSLYRWKGEIERAAEVVMIVKTTAEAADAAMDAIAKAHSYEVPALVVLPVERASQTYGAWIAEEVAAEGDPKKGEGG
jgi:periplasmic divalent cation tolerance protein